jgi:hypothetical protein
VLLPLLLNNLLTAGGGAGEDNLTAVSVESDSEVSSPSVGQKHGLTATSVQSLSQLTSPAVGQKHALTSVSVQATSNVSTPILGPNEDALTASSIQSLSQVSRPTLTVPTEATAGGHYWPDDHKLKKPKDYRPELDDKRVREREELRQTINRAAGLIDDAIEQAPAVEQQATALNVELGKLREYAEELDRNPERELHAIQERVDGLIARSVDDLIVQIADLLTDLIQEIADDSDD